MAEYGHIYNMFAIFGYKYPIIATHGGIWPFIAKYGHIFINMAIFGHRWPKKIFFSEIWPGVIAIFGHIARTDGQYWPYFVKHFLSKLFMVPKWRNMAI